MLEIRGIWLCHMSRWDRYVLRPRIWVETPRSGTVPHIGPYSIPKVLSLILLDILIQTGLVIVSTENLPQALVIFSVDLLYVWLRRNRIVYKYLLLKPSILMLDHVALKFSGLRK